jgi:pSer/pThr/pTyr-binding forkhead associated (FHA) protein
VRDENSANGTLVNGQRINEHLLEDGDKIQVGQTLLVFVYR